MFGLTYIRAHAREMKVLAKKASQASQRKVNLVSFTALTPKNLGRLAKMMSQMASQFFVTI